MKWDEAAEPAKIVGPIYFVGTKGLSVFLITTSEGLIVLNTGMAGSGPMIAAAIRKLGFKPEDIKILLAGHAHSDHAGGHAYLKKLSGAKIAIIREEDDIGVVIAQPLRQPAKARTYTEGGSFDILRAYPKTVIRTSKPPPGGRLFSLDFD